MSSPTWVAGTTIRRTRDQGSLRSQGKGTILLRLHWFPASFQLHEQPLSTHMWGEMGGTDMVRVADKLILSEVSLLVTDIA